MATEAGAFLDAVLDRIGEFAVLCGVAFYYRDRPAALALCAAVLGVSALISYMRAKAEALGVQPPRVMLRRPERVLYLGNGLALSPVLAAFAEPLAARPWNHLFLAVAAFVAVVGAAGLVRTSRAVLRTLRAREPAREQPRLPATHAPHFDSSVTKS